MNCGQCVHFEKSAHTLWGFCSAEVPGWVREEKKSDNGVCINENSAWNHANYCDLFATSEGAS